MWYFSWVLGVGFAALFSILNAMWYEMQSDTFETDLLDK
jgi:cyd operon protein YbgT